MAEPEGGWNAVQKGSSGRHHLWARVARGAYVPFSRPRMAKPRAEQHNKWDDMCRRGRRLVLCGGVAGGELRLLARTVPRHRDFETSPTSPERIQHGVCIHRAAFTGEECDAIVELLSSQRPKERCT